MKRKLPTEKENREGKGATLGYKQEKDGKSVHPREEGGKQSIRERERETQLGR